MKSAQASTNEILIDLQGQILGLKAVLNSILVANPGIKVEDHQIGRSIILTKGLAVDDPRVSKKARETAQDVIGRNG
jgi:hypothetical protein